MSPLLGNSDWDRDLLRYAQELRIPALSIQSWTDPLAEKLFLVFNSTPFGIRRVTTVARSTILRNDTTTIVLRIRKAGEALIEDYLELVLLGGSCQ